MPKYDLAISFAGEQRKIAEYFARRLDSSGYSIFYDEFEQATLWGQDLSIKLGDVYSKEARYCLILVSKEYITKAWTNLERQNAISRFMNSRSDYILCLRIDDLSLPGLPPVIGYISLRSLGEAKVYQLLLEKLGPPNHDDLVSHLSENDQRIAKKIIEICYRRAIFSHMKSEIDINAMSLSLGEVIGNLQKVTSRIDNPKLQYDVLEIIGAIDSIQRMMKNSDARVSHHLETDTANEINKNKIHIIESLLKIKRSAKLSIQLPFALQTDHFFGLKSANEPPS